jgi:hypothetical protein
MSRTTSAVAVSTIGVDTGKNTLHLIGLDEQGMDRFAGRRGQKAMPAFPKRTNRSIRVETH